MAKVVSNDQRDWDSHVPFVMAAYNSSKHESTGYSPNQLLFGRETRTPIDIVCGSATQENHWEDYHKFVSERVSKMQTAYESVRSQLKTVALGNKNRYDMRVRRHSFNKGDCVYYFNPRKYVNKSPKWMKMFTGPYLVTRVMGSVNYEVQQSQRAKPFIVHVDKLKTCYAGHPHNWLKGSCKRDGNETEGVAKFFLDETTEILCENESKTMLKDATENITEIKRIEHWNSGRSESSDKPDARTPRIADPNKRAANYTKAKRPKSEVGTTRPNSPSPTSSAKAKLILCLLKRDLSCSQGILICSSLLLNQIFTSLKSHSLFH